MSFSDSYAEARERFRDAARRAGAKLTMYRNPAGPQVLCTDVAWLGPATARNVLFVVSGTHGVEGYCGSAGQIALLTGPIPATLPPDTAVLLVHALMILYAAVSVLLGITYGMALPAVQARAVNLADPLHRPRLLPLAGLLFEVAILVFPLAAGFLIRLGSYRLLFVVLLGFSIAVALLGLRRSVPVRVSA